MSNSLDSLFDSVKRCKEEGHPCVVDNKNIKNIYKPDSGINDSKAKKDIFPNCEEAKQPKLCDCVLELKNSKVYLVEIKCGEVTSSLVKQVHEKLSNTLKLVKYKNISISKSILMYKKFNNVKVRQMFESKKYYIQNHPIRYEVYKNKAIAI